MKSVVCSLLLTMLIALSASFTSAQEDAQPPILQRETGIGLYDVAWSPDGQLLAVAGDNGITILDDELQEVTVITGHMGSVLSVSWSPDGSRLASSGGVDDHTVKIWDYDAITGAFSLVTTLETTSDVVPQVRWSPDGTMVAGLLLLGTHLTGNSDSLGTFVVWDATTWDTVVDFGGYVTDPIRKLAWDPDSSALLLAGIDGAYGAPIDLTDEGWYKRLPSKPIGLAWSSISNLVAYTYRDITILDGTTGQVVYELVPNTNITFNIVWSPLADHIAASTLTGIDVVDVHTGTILRKFEPFTSIWAMDWSADGSRLVTATSHGEIALWDASNLPSTEGTPTITPNPTNTPRPTPTATPSGGG